MHEALRIPEILSHICTFAEKCSLARLARCCSRFQEPANMVLWEHPPNILPLIRCFPGDVWSVAESPEGSSELVSPSDCMQQPPQLIPQCYNYPVLYASPGAARLA